MSLHCPLTPETKHLINKQTLSQMKCGSMLINTARGALIDARAAIDALKTRDHLWYLGIDVYDEEGPLFFTDLSSTIIQDDVFERLTTKGAATALDLSCFQGGDPGDAHRAEFVERAHPRALPE